MRSLPLLLRISRWARPGCFIVRTARNLMAVFAGAVEGGQRGATSRIEGVGRTIGTSQVDNAGGSLPNREDASQVGWPALSHSLTRPCMFLDAQHSSHNVLVQIELRPFHPNYDTSTSQSPAYLAQQIDNMSSPAAQTSGVKGGKEPILFRFCSEW